MSVQCELTIAKTLAPHQAAALTFTLTNSGTEAVQVLNWQTPFEGIRAPMFTVKRNGNELEYRGVMVKRAAPRPQDYLAIGPAERRQATIDLAEAWDVTPAGSYTVEYSGELFDVVAGTAAVPSASGTFRSLSPKCKAAAFTRQP